jgi:hypothetical protein
MRKKEGLSDYRYFPEPDLPEVILKKEYVNSIQNSLPELPEMKRRRYENMGLSMQDVLFLANDINVSPCHGPECLLYFLGSIFQLVWDQIHKSLHSYYLLSLQELWYRSIEKRYTLD